MAVSQDVVRDALKTVLDSNTGKDIVAGKAVTRINVDGDKVDVDLVLGYPSRTQLAPMQQKVEAALKALAGVRETSVNVTMKIEAHAVQRGVKLVPGIKNIIAVASAKGGVGKSTTATNLALALAAEGATVGVLDADIYGPSQPMMLGISGKPESKDGKSIEPMMGYGIQAISIGFMIGADTPMVWRGPMEIGRAHV